MLLLIYLYVLYTPLSVFCLLVLFFFLLHHTACRILAPQPGFESGPSAMRVQCPKHWTTRNAFWFFVVFFFFLSIFYYLFFLFFLPFFFFPLLQTLLSRADFQQITARELLCYIQNPDPEGGHLRMVQHQVAHERVFCFSVAFPPRSVLTIYIYS